MSSSFAFQPAEPAHWAGVLLASVLIGVAKWALGKFITSDLFSWAGYIDPGFAAHEKLDSQDLIYLCTNCVITVPFFYHFNGFLFSETQGSVNWNMGDITLWNTVGSTLAQFGLYDFIYHLFHRSLHHRSIYHLIHKHHHKQKAPFRGVFDGINVHPLEFVVGIYLHLFAIWAIPCHIVGAQLFFGLASLMAAFNHTRWGVHCPYFYDVRDHDLHHVLFNCNYAQYVMWWDKLFGTFKESPQSRPPLKSAAKAS